MVILKPIGSLGDMIKEFRVNGTAEFHAVPNSGDGARVARCNDGLDDEAAYRAACMLAEAVGIDLEDG